MRKFLFLAMVLLTLTACSEEVETSTYEKIHEKLISMESFSYNAEVKYISNKGETEYEVNILGKSTGEYKMETISPKSAKGSIILFDGKMIWQYNPKIDGKISSESSDKQARSEILISSFVENYIKTKNGAVKSGSFDESKCTVLDAEINGKSKIFSQEKLWVDNDTLIPIKLEIYDNEQKTRAVVVFKDFKYNPNIPENTFKKTFP